MALRVDDVDLQRDRTLVERAQAGDGAAFAELYARYFDRLCRFCERRLGDRHEAEEVAQEAFTRAYRALADLDGERKFYPWLSVIAGRVCIDVHRRRSRSQPAAEVDPGAVEGGQEEVLRATDSEAVQRALDRLSPRHQEVLRLREWEGWSYQHLADHFSMSMAGTEALLWRARQALRREYERLNGAPERWAGLPALPVAGAVFRRLAGARQAVARVVHAVGWPIMGGAVSVALVGAIVLGGAPSHLSPPRPPTTVVTQSTASSGDPGVTPSSTAPVSVAPAPTSGTPAPNSPGTAPPASSAPPPAALHPVRNSSIGPVGSAGSGAERGQPVYAEAGGTAVGIDPNQVASDLTAQVATATSERTAP